MTEIIQDNVDVTLQIGVEGGPSREGFEGSAVPDEFDEEGGIFWDVIEMKVELSQVASPNYVKGKVTPQPEYSNVLNAILNPSADETDAPEDTEDSLELPNNGISKLVGSHFRLEADNDLVAVPGDETENQIRDLVVNVEEDVDEDSLLFNGRLANISPIGTNVYEIVAYDPGQQAFNLGEESGSVLNQKLDFTGQSVDFNDPEDEADNNEPGDYSITAFALAQEIASQAELGPRTTILEEDFEATIQFPQYIAGIGNFETEIPTGELVRIDFKKLVVPVKEALNRIREATNTEWWFDKDGTFYFGDPGNPTLEDAGSQVYQISLITDTSAGITTPPYQSVRVIGRGVASSDGWSSNANIQDEDDKLIVTANISQPNAGGEQAQNIIELDPDSLQEPTFKYINAEIGTDKQAQNTALKVANELIKQQASGTVTVVGMAEVQPFDGILLPNTERQPMGGQLYDVYSVTHKLNTSDGFITEIEVAGPNPRIRQKADVGTQAQENIIATSIDRDVYTSDGERRAFASGAGEGDE